MVRESQQQLPRQAAEANSAETPVFLGPLPFVHWSSWAPPSVSRVLLPVAVGSLSLWVASPGALSQLPASLEATDPKSPKESSQRACHARGAHPTASGVISRMAVGSRSLWAASPGSESSPSSLGRKSLTAWVQLTIGPHSDDLFAQ